MSIQEKEHGTEIAENSKTEDKGAVGTVSASSLRDWITEGHKNQIRNLPRGSAAVLIPILIRDGAYHVLYEVRAAKLHTQPGEICFPGGRIEPGELPLEAAVREATEELLIHRDQIEIVGELEKTTGPGMIAFYSFIGVLNDYEGTWSEDEVERVFTIPLEWILYHLNAIFRTISLMNMFPEVLITVGETSIILFLFTRMLSTGREMNLSSGA